MKLSLFVYIHTQKTLVSSKMFIRVLVFAVCLNKVELGYIIDVYGRIGDNIFSVSSMLKQA